MKVAIITDTHYGARKGSKFLHDYFELFYKNIFFPSLKEYGVDTVIHMGDAFDSRKSIDYQSLEWAKRVVFDPLMEYNVHMIIGNHDVYYKNTNDVNSPDLLLQKYSNIKTYSKATEVNIIHYEDTNYKLFNAAELKDKIVKVIVRKKSKPKDFEKFIDKIYSAGVQELKIIENFAIQESEDFEINEEENTISILNRYIDESEFEYDKSVIKGIFEDLYRQACEVE